MCHRAVVRADRRKDCRVASEVFWYHTRREELLLGPDITQRVWLLRRMYGTMTAEPPHGAGMDMATAMDALLQRMSKTDTNIEFLESLKDKA